MCGFNEESSVWENEIIWVENMSVLISLFPISIFPIFYFLFPYFLFSIFYFHISYVLIPL